MTNIERANALYHTLRVMKGRDFKEENFKWVLGYEVYRDFRPFFIFQQAYSVEPTLLYGIMVEVDMHNPFTFKLYEDITDKVAIPASEIDALENGGEHDSDK